MLLSLRKNGQTSLFKEVRVFKAKMGFRHWLEVAQKWVQSGFRGQSYEEKGLLLRELGPETHFGPTFGPLPANDENPFLTRFCAKLIVWRFWPWGPSDPLQAWSGFPDNDASHLYCLTCGHRRLVGLQLVGQPCSNAPFGNIAFKTGVEKWTCADPYRNTERLKVTENFVSRLVSSSS